MFPPLMERFQRLGGAIGTSREARILHEIYQDMPAHNCFSELLQRLPEQAVVIEMNGVLWSEWGKPEQIAHTLRRIGRQPAFPLDCLHRPFAPIAQVIYGGGAQAGL